MKRIQEKIKMTQALLKPLDLASRPYEALARKLGQEEKETIEGIKKLIRQGIVRRIGCLLNPRKIGLSANALVVWKIRNEEVQVTGKKFARRAEITHCYARKPRKGWPYNLYTMIHETNRRQCRALIETMIEESGALDHKVLWTIRELKKSRGN